MSFPLKFFESHLPSDILGRGESYWINDAVQNLALDGDTWEADVYGTDNYTVEVKIRDGEVTEWFCDCPYDWGPICKHVAAVLFTIRDEAPETPAQEIMPRPGRKKVARPAKDPVGQILGKLDAAELRGVLEYLAKREDEVKAYLLSKYSHLLDMVSKNHYRDLVKSVISAHSGGRHGFIEYREASRLGDRIWHLLKEAQEPSGSMGLVYLCEEVIRQLARTFNDADDSSGSMGMAMEEAFSLLEGMASNENTPPEAVEYIFDYAVRESSIKDYQGWGWADNLRSLACNAVRIKSQADTLMQSLEKTIEENKKEEYGKYEVERAERLKLVLLRKFHSEKEADKYLHSHLQYSSFREMALEKALEEKRFGDVRRLANEGIELDTQNRLPGLVERWKKWLMRLAEFTGDTQTLVDLTEKMFLSSGDMDLFRKLKSLLSEEVFQQKTVQYIQYFRDVQKQYFPQRHRSQFNERVADILVEENRLDDLMAEVEKSPALHLLDRYAPLLAGRLKPLYIELYDKGVRQEMDRGSGRGLYQTCCGYVDKILKLGGLEQAKQIVHDWREQYPRRRAMLEELERYRF